MEDENSKYKEENMEMVVRAAWRSRVLEARGGERERTGLERARVQRCTKGEEGEMAEDGGSTKKGETRKKEKGRGEGSQW